MPTPPTVALQVFLAVVVVMTAAYLAGRIHQWSRRTVERHEAFQDGYDRASQALFHLATRSVSAVPARPGQQRDTYPAPSQPAYGSARRRSQVDVIQRGSARRP